MNVQAWVDKGTTPGNRFIRGAVVYVGLWVVLFGGYFAMRDISSLIP